MHLVLPALEVEGRLAAPTEGLVEEPVGLIAEDWEVGVVSHGGPLLSGDGAPGAG